MLTRRGDVRARGQSAGALEMDVELATRRPTQPPARRRGPRRAHGRALDALPADAREVVVLRDVQGLSTKEAARVLGISEGAVKVRLHRRTRG
jgi:RNA polymerase sigma-70 factor (ECF subfamily)